MDSTTEDTTIVCKHATERHALKMCARVRHDTVDHSQYHVCTIAPAMPWAATGENSPAPAMVWCYYKRYGCSRTVGLACDCRLLQGRMV